MKGGKARDETRLESLAGSGLPGESGSVKPLRVGEGDAANVATVSPTRRRKAGRVSVGTRGRRF